MLLTLAPFVAATVVVAVFMTALLASVRRQSDALADLDVGDVSSG